MRKFLSIVLASVMLSLSTGCFGEFALVRKVYSWNEDVTDSRFVQTLLFYAMNIIPVYGIAGVVDFWILNLIEFWSGSNPLSMQDGDFEKQIIPIDGEEFIVEATKNQFRMYPSGNESEAVILRFRQEDQSWNLIQNDREEKLISLKETSEGNFYQVYAQESTLNFDTQKAYSKDLIRTLLCSDTEVALK